MEYEIAHHTGQCHVTGRKLAEGEPFYAVLIEAGDGFERRDYSLDAWPAEPPPCFSYWRSRVPRREEKKKRLLVDNDVIINLFQRLETEEEPVRQHFRFVLALILMRKRLLKYEDTVRRDGQEFWRMRLGSEEAVHEVWNPRLNDEQIEAVSRQLGAILHGDAAAFAELNEPSRETADPPSAV